MALFGVQRLSSDRITISAPDVSGVVDNLLLIQFGQQGNELQRQLSILKVRDSAYDPSLLEVVMNDAGIVLKKV